MFGLDNNISVCAAAPGFAKSSKKCQKSLSPYKTHHCKVIKKKSRASDITQVTHLQKVGSPVAVWTVCAIYRDPELCGLIYSFGHRAYCKTFKTQKPFLKDFDKWYIESVFKKTTRQIFCITSLLTVLCLERSLLLLIIFPTVFFREKYENQR